jgi:diguanylate cyclase (GGDEF)-like protein
MKQLLFQIKDAVTLGRALEEIRAACAPACAGSVLLHVYCGYLCNVEGWDCNAFAAQITQRIEAILPEAELIGLSSGGEICRAEVTAPCVLLSAFLFRSARVRVLSFPDILADEKAAGEGLARAVELSPDAQAVELLLAGRGIDSAPIYECLRNCRERLPFFGGYAAEHDPMREPAFLLTKQGLLQNSMAAVLYEGAELHVEAGRDTGWKPLGSAFRVTGAEGRRLYSVSGVPAYELYDRFLKFPEGESFRDWAMEFPLMVRQGKMKLLRHPQEKYEDNSILLDGRVREGEEICLSYGAPLNVIRRINARCEKIRAFEPEAILLYSCQGRKKYWGELIGWEMEPFQKLAESGGACLDGQIMRNNQTGRVIEHRLTLLSVAMREGEKTGRPVPEIAVDDEILQGRMSLVHRMSTLIESMVAELQKANDELLRLAVTDELTGLYNRREIERRIKEALARARAEHRKIALVMLDIDFFKRVNDTYGHDAGDLVLKEVSAILRSSADAAFGEAAGRWGGEEFFLLLPEKCPAEAVTVAEQIRRTVEGRDFPEVGRLTVSLGVTCADPEANYQETFIQADRALYMAKTGGRNRVIGLF